MHSGTQSTSRTTVHHTRPTREVWSRLSLLALVPAVTATLVLPVPASARDQGPAPLPPEMAELARQLEGTAPDGADEPRDEPARDVPVDDSAPTERLKQARQQTQALIVTADRPTATSLRTGVAALDDAVTLLSSGSPEMRSVHLSDALAEIARAVAHLDDARHRTDRQSGAAIAEIARQVATAAGDVVEPVVARAASAGADPAVLRGAQHSFRSGMDKLAAGDSGGAVDDIGDTLADASGLIEFDVEVFEQNLRDAFDGEAIGYTYAIALNGTIVAEDGVGQARTAPDSPADQYANKQVMVASVSKTLTAILVLGLMEQEGVHPDDLIAPYLPSNWAFGDGMDQLTFRQLLTHTSGIKQLINTLPPGTAGNDYEGLRTLIAMHLPAGPGPDGYLYTNLNFALQRILVAGLMGIDPVDYPEFESATLTASAFEIHLQSVYGGIGVPASCSPTDPEPTLMYQWPLDGLPGGESNDKVLICGGVGFFISAHQLAEVLANLRYTENLMSQTQLDTMRDGLLGLQSWGGDHGSYLGHGGEWTPGMQSCVMMFPINVDAAITVNSIGGNYPSPCSVARSAFDDAWVAI